MSNLIATKRVDLLAPYLALDQGARVQAECESYLTSMHISSHHPFDLALSSTCSHHLATIHSIHRLSLLGLC
jgi:hypothetical protein